MFVKAANALARQHTRAGASENRLNKNFIGVKITIMRAGAFRCIIAILLLKVVAIFLF